MLFAVKNRLRSTLLTLGAFAAVALLLRSVLGLRWNLQPYSRLLPDLALALMAMMASDAIIHGLLSILFPHRYHRSYQALAEYFQPQQPREILGGGILAGVGEEPLFRGILVGGLIANAGFAPAAAVGVSAVCFGALHVLRDRRLWLFGMWAAWQGILLGSIYLATGSLLLVAILHALHDTIGFSLLRMRRSDPDADRHGAAMLGPRRQ